MTRLSHLNICLLTLGLLFSTACNKGSTTQGQDDMGGDDHGGAGGGEVPEACAHIDLDSRVRQTATCLTADTDASAHITVRLRDKSGEAIQAQQLNVQRQTELLALGDFQELDDNSNIFTGTYFLQVRPSSEAGSEQISIEVPCNDEQSITLNTQVTFTVVPSIADEGSLLVSGCLNEDPEKNIGVQVLDANSQAPIEGASVLLGTMQNPLAHTVIESYLQNLQPPRIEALQLSNEQGQVSYHFWDATNLGDKISADKLSIAAPGYENISLIGITKSQIRVELKPLAFPEGNWNEIELETATVSINGFQSSEDNEPKVDLGAVLPANSIDAWTRLDRHALLPGTKCWQPQPNNNADLRFMVPTNAYIPDQNINGQVFSEQPFLSTIRRQTNPSMPYFAMFGSVEIADLIQPSNPSSILGATEIIGEGQSVFQSSVFEEDSPVREQLQISTRDLNYTFRCDFGNIVPGYSVLCGSFYAPPINGNTQEYLPEGFRILPSEDLRQPGGSFNTTATIQFKPHVNFRTRYQESNAYTQIAAIIDTRSAYPLASAILQRGDGPYRSGRGELIIANDFMPTKRFRFGPDKDYWFRRFDDPVSSRRPEVDYCEMTVHLELQKRAPSDCEVDGESLIEHQTIFTAPIHTFYIGGDVSTLDRIDLPEPWHGMDHGALLALAQERGIFNNELNDGYYQLSYFSDINCYGEVESNDQSGGFDLDQKKEEFTHFTSNKIPFPEGTFTSLPENVDIPIGIPGSRF